MSRKLRTTVCWLLIGVLLSTPSWTYAAEKAAADRAGPASDLVKYVTPDAVVGAIAQPRRVLTGPEMELLPTEVITAAGEKELGFDPMQLEQVLAVIEPPGLAGPPQAGVVLRFAEKAPAEAVATKLGPRTTEGTLNGKTYRQGRGLDVPSIFAADEKTLVIAHDGLLRRMVSQDPARQGTVGKLLAGEGTSSDLTAAFAMEPVRGLLAAQLEQAPLPPPLAGLKKTPELVESAEVGVNLGLMQGTSIALKVHAKDEAAAKELEQLIQNGLDMAKQAMAAELEREMARALQSEDPVERAMAKYLERVRERMFGQTFEIIQPKRDGDTLVLALGGKTSPEQARLQQVAVIGFLVALLLPAVQAARESARRNTAASNLKMIGLAMHNYHDTYRHLPARANFDKQGKPLLSWRVHLLPFLEQQALYRQFRLDEPWDSDHNKKLIEKMPAVYRNPSSPAAPGKTDFLAVVGKGLAFEGTKGRAFTEFRDGLSQTILVVEANPDKAVTWTRPDDWELDPKEPLAGLGKAHPGGFQVLIADGSVRFIAATVSEEVFKALLTIAGEDRVGL